MSVTDRKYRNFVFYPGVAVVVLLLEIVWSSATPIIGKVTSIQGRYIEFEGGGAKGIKVGDTGRVYYMVTIDGKEKPVYVARFKVTYFSTKDPCVAKIEEETANVRVGYLMEMDTKAEEKPSSARKHEKPSSAKRLFKPEKGSFEFFYDDTKWVASSDPYKNKGLELRLIGEEGYAVVVATSIELPTSAMRDKLLEEMKNKYPDARIYSEENRLVNGREILSVLFNGTVDKIPFVGYGYVYGGREGTILVLTITAQNLFEKYYQPFTDFLNGLIIY